MASPKPTLPNGREEQDSAYNPGDLRYSEENFGTPAKPSDASSDTSSGADVGDEERNGSDELKNGYYRPSPGGKQKKITLKSIFNKKGPVGLILALIFGGGGAATFLFAPGLGIVQLKEVLVGDLNDQLAAFDIRSDSMWRTKLKGLQGNFSLCSNVVNIRCKFGTVSERMVNKLKAAGFDVRADNKAFGRQLIRGMTAPDGTPISNPNELNNLRRKNPVVRSALTKVYNPLVASLSDNKAIGVLNGKYKTSKAKKLTATNATGLSDQMASSTAGDGVASQNYIQSDEDGKYVVDETGEKHYEGSDKYNDITSNTNRIVSAADDAAKSGVKAVSGVIGGALKGVSILGVADSACTVYNTARAVAAAAKATRAIQLAQYSMVFLNTADSIKAGVATPEEVEYLGNILTSTDTREFVTDELAVVGSELDQRPNPYYGKNAFDSPGYAVAAYNDAPTLTSRSQQYMVGGGLTGSFSSVTDSITQIIGVGNPRAIPEVCGVIQSWWVRGIGLVVGIAAAVGSFGTSTVISVGASLAIAFALPFLSAALADIIAGKVVGPDTKGVDAGDALFAGTSTMLGGVAQARGLKPLGESDLEGYLALSDRVESEYIAQGVYEAKDTPFDIMNQYSFLGSFARTLNVPIMQASSSNAGGFAAIPGILKSSLASIVPSANAATSYNPDRFNKCSDVGYQNLGIKADVFCNVRFGLSNNELALDPEAVLSFMLDGEHVDVYGEPKSNDYKDFLKYCADRVDGWGETGAEGEDLSKSSGEWCMQESDMLSKFRVFTIDNSVSQAMDVEAANAGNDGLGKQALAKKIIAKNKVTYLGEVSPTLEEIAEGADGNADPCGINIYILRIIDAVTDKHSIKISDLNRKCKNKIVSGSGPFSPHWAGNGSAMDIAVIDGRATTGRDANALKVIEIAMPFLVEAAAAGNRNSRIEQAQCGRVPNLGVGVIEFVATRCNHLHLDVPAAADPELEHS